MLSIKEITEKFEVTRATLHNWKTTKPVLYNHLILSDSQYDKYREINIFLNTYIKTANINIFTIKEIDYISTLSLEINDIQDIQDLAIIYINTSTKIKKENDIFSLDIYTKLNTLNLIEKYVFCDRLKIFKSKIKSNKDEKTKLMDHYFKEFLKI